LCVAQKREFEGIKMNKQDFGIDAPILIRNLFLASLLTLILFIGVAYFLKETFVGIIFRILISLAFLGTFIPFILLMLSSKFFKIFNRDRLLRKFDLTGDENILDVGCGCGLYTIGFASKMTTGKVYGIDIWNPEDISKNSETAIGRNVKSSGLEKVISLKTEDMRKMSFKDNYFDMVIASFSIHNISDSNERGKALSEIYRVTKPSGKIVIIDFKNIGEYITYFKSMKCELLLEAHALGLFPFTKNLIFRKTYPV
jgi:ubiquinone/menaquinone biosynthesis C-methylase UbiE